MSTENVTEGSFVWWLARQPRSSEAGKLSLLLFADLAATRLASCPTSLREVREWATGRPESPVRLQLWLSASVAAWKRWLLVTPVSALIPGPQTNEGEQK